jgi:HlyD family secretion protein
LVGVAVVIAAAGASVWWVRRSGNASYTTAPVTRGSIAAAVTASGTVNPVTTVQVGSYVSGVITQVSCDYNTTVKKGQLCAKIDPRPYQSTVDQEQANLETAQAQLRRDQTNLDYTKLAYDRNTQLSSRGIVSQDDLDSATNAYHQAQAQVKYDQAQIDQRQATVASARVNLGYTNIVSPVDGTVVSRNITVGQTVAASFQTPTLFLIASDLTKMEVDASVSESDIGRVSNGSTASFSVEAYPDHPFQGLVTEVRQAPQTVQNVVTYDVVINAPNPDRLLKPGMTANVHITVDARQNALIVPDQALRFSPGASGGGGGRQGGVGQDRVWVLQSGQPVQVPVKVGLNNGTQAEILSGNLQPGDRVIVSGTAGARGGGRGGTPRFRL